MIQYRRLEKHELTPELFQDFIRHQTVQDCYRKREGRWVIEPAPFIDDWSREEYDFLVQCLKDTIDGNGAVYGAFQAEALGHDLLGGFHPDIAVVPGPGTSGDPQRVCVRRRRTHGKPGPVQGYDQPPCI